MKELVKISDNFRKMAVKCVFAIFLFLATYILLIILAIGFTALCAYCGFLLMISYPMWLTIIFGAGLISLGIFILIFIFKFIFTSYQTDRAHLYEITAEQQPGLFSLIESIVTQINTNFPKKVYLSAEVNAAVFYDSSFWSMFLPVRKNLQIGMGLLNCVTVSELEAILAHEFGHFSQRSMKLGSYVYNVNRVIHNMLFDNESYQNMMKSWAGISAYISIFVNLAAAIIQGIQIILRKMYEIVNINYLALSREMEFHADAVAATVAGSQPLISSLMRLELADESLNTVFDYYNTKIATAEKTENFYPQQYFVLKFIAEKNALPVVEGLPQVSSEHFKRFKKSRLVLKDQWSSHPGTEERVSRIRMFNKPVKQLQQGIAVNLLRDKENLQQQITAYMFRTIQYHDTPQISDEQKFRDDFVMEYERKSYADLYNGYYYSRDPLSDKNEEAFGLPSKLSDTEGSLFDNKLIAMISSITAMNQDLLVLEQISDGFIKVKSFDYDGQKYTFQDCHLLMRQIRKELEFLNAQAAKRDEDIFEFFLQLAWKQDQLTGLKYHYYAYQLSVHNLVLLDIFNQLSNALYFIQVSTPFDQIRQNFLLVKKIEIQFRADVSQLLNGKLYEDEVTKEIRDRFERYLSKEWVYFTANTYHHEELDLLFKTLVDFQYVLHNTNFKKKKALLDFQACLWQNK